MNVGEKPVDNCGIRSQRPGLLSSFLSFRDFVFSEQDTAELLVTKPVIWAQLEPVPDHFFALWEISCIDQKGSQSDHRFAILVIAHFNGFSEALLSLISRSKSQIGHSDLVIDLIKGRCDRNCLLKIHESCLRVVV